MASPSGNAANSVSSALDIIQELRDGFHGRIRPQGGQEQVHELRDTPCRGLVLQRLPQQKRRLARNVALDLGFRHPDDVENLHAKGRDVAVEGRVHREQFTQGASAPGPRAMINNHGNDHGQAFGQGRFLGALLPEHEHVTQDLQGAVRGGGALVLQKKVDRRGLVVLEPALVDQVGEIALGALAHEAAPPRREGVEVDGPRYLRGQVVPEKLRRRGRAAVELLEKGVVLLVDVGTHAANLLGNRYCGQQQGTQPDNIARAGCANGYFRPQLRKNASKAHSVA